MRLFLYWYYKCLHSYTRKNIIELLLNHLLLLTIVFLRNLRVRLWESLRLSGHKNLQANGDGADAAGRSPTGAPRYSFSYVKWVRCYDDRCRMNSINSGRSVLEPPRVRTTRSGRAALCHALSPARRTSRLSPADSTPAPPRRAASYATYILQTSVIHNTFQINTS